ncbi:MAG TPA: alpha-L-fucosidase [Thermomicrobiales bacterium]|nr:alpha-L-fucosidase [Thermomicrobiales bacterium]
MTSRTDWFVHDRFGLFIHFGIYSAGARHEWLKKREAMTTETYQKYFDHFDPDRYDPQRWARDAKAAGMRYSVITTKHHDGFCLFDSALTDYTATNTPFGRDIIAEFVEAFRAEGLRVGFCYSVIDWHHEDYTRDQVHPQSDDDAFWAGQNRDIARYRAYLHGQVRELLTNYGTIDVMWFDFTPPTKSREDWQSAELAAIVRELQPDIILNDRIDLPESADFVTPEQYQPREWLTRDGERVTWEACQTLNGSWGYDRDNLDWKSPQMLVRMLVDTVAKGGNLLLNVGPTGRGEFEPRARETLAAIGEWTRLHGHAIYGATAEEAYEASVDCRYTRRGDRLYLHVFTWPMRHIHLEGMAGKIEYAQLLHDASEVKVTDPDPEAQVQNITPPGFEGVATLELPIQRPDVLVPVIELFLK